MTIWSPALLPFFERSNTSTRPAILGLLEDFFLPLKEDLKPITRPFLLAVLPGLEEEGAENFDRTLKLLDGLEKCVDKDLFWRCLWATVIGNPAIGQAAVHFLHKRSPPIPQQLKTTSEANAAGLSDGRQQKQPLSAHLVLMPRALSALLSSQELLTIRGGLDLLLQLLPLDTVFYHSMPSEDRLELMQSAIGVVRRRELSLNRRLWSWLGGTGRSAAHAAAVRQSSASASLRSRDETLDSEEQELLYLQSFGLDDLREAVLFDVRACSYEPTKSGCASNDSESEDEDPHQDEQDAQHKLTAAQRPLRVFLALLDKWSVGAALTDSAVLDVWASLRTIHIRYGADATKDLMTTATMLFDAVDKSILTRKLVEGIAADFTQGSPETVGLLLFIVEHFSFKDDLSRAIHLPHLLLLLIEQAERALKQASLDKQKTFLLMREAIKACKALLDLIDLPAVQRLEAEVSATSDSVATLKAFYSSQSTDKVPIDFRSHAVQQALLQCCASLFQQAESTVGRDRQERQSLIISEASLNLCTALFRKISAGTAAVASSADAANETSQCSLSLPLGWTHLLLGKAGKATSFSELESALFTIDAVISCPLLVPRLDLLSNESKRQTCAVYANVRQFLLPDAVMFHSRAVDLFWLLDSHTAKEGLLQTLSCAEILSERRMDQFLLAFGVIWRLSDPAKLSSPACAAPLGHFLDLLQSPDQRRRQAVETWLRVNVRSYAPIFNLVLGSFRRATGSGSMAHCTIRCAEGTDVKTLVYTHPFDHRLLNHWLSVLLAIARYGGAGFVRAATTTSPSPSTGPTYMEECLAILLRLLRTSRRASYSDLDATTHTHCADFLQLAASKNGFTTSQLADIETLLLERLLVGIEGPSGLNQHRLLLALHTVISSKAGFHARQRDVSGGGGSNGSSSGSSPSTAFNPHPLLLRTLRAGLAQPGRYSLLPHWADFVLMTLPQYRRCMASLLVPLHTSVCKTIAEAEAEIHDVFHGPLPEVQRTTSSLPSLSLSMREDDFVTLINVSERIVLLCLEENGGNQHKSEGHRRQETGHPASGSGIAQPPPAVLQAATPSSKKTASGNPTIEENSSQQQQYPHQQVSNDVPAAGSGVGIFGYVTGIFGGESTPGNGTPQHGTPPTSPSILALQLCLRALHSLWVGLSDEQAPRDDDQRATTFAVMSGKVRQRVRRCFERLYKVQPAAALETLVDCWSRADAGTAGKAQAESIFEIVNLLVAGHQMVVTFLCDLLAQRLPSPGSSRPNWTPNQLVSEGMLMSFLEVYVTRLESPAAAQGVWPIIVVLVKDLIANSTAHKGYLPPALRCLTVLGEKLLASSAAASSTSTMTAAAVAPPPEDRRMRREMQEVYVKLFDLCVLIAGRSFEAATTNWMIPARADFGDEKAAMSGSIASLSDFSSSALVDYLSSTALPALRKIASDQDKVSSCCNNAIYYILSPPLRIKNAHRSFEHIDPSILALATEIGRTMPLSLKTLRGPVSDAFMDGRFFKMSATAGKRWRGPIVLLYATDRDRYFVGEVLGRISATASANIFTNREAEVVVRSLSLRRLTFVLFSGAKDQFLAQLPQVQEKLVEMLRSHPIPDRVAAEAYLCLRVMLLRFQSRHLTTLWPIIITELVRLFESYASGGEEGGTATQHLPADGSDGVHLLVAACKFVDALLCLRTPEFQVHQWLFVNDSDLGGDEFGLEEGLFDRLAEAIEASGAAGSGGGKGAASVAAAPSSLRSKSRGGVREPLLTGVPKLSGLRDLVPFLRLASSTSFQRSIAGAAKGDVNWAALDRDVLADLFEGSA